MAIASMLPHRRALIRLVLASHLALAPIGPTLVPIVASLLTPFEARADAATDRQAEIKTLTRETIVRVPELQALWQWQAQNHADILIGGGLARGTIRWVQRNLQTLSPSEVRALPAPRLDDLLPQKDSDIDIQGSNKDLKRLQEALPEYRNSRWDKIDPAFRKYSLGAGGSTIDRVLIGPNRIDDPLGALPDLAEGRLTFLWPTPRKIYGSTLGWSQGTFALWSMNNSYLTLALRFLRMAEEFPDLAVDPELIQRFHGIPSLEANLLRRSATLSDRQQAQRTRFDHWILKGMRKLHDAAGQDFARTAAILNSAGLLHALAEHRYGMRAKFDQPSHGIDLFKISPDRLAQEGLATEPSLRAMARIAYLNPEQTVRWLSYASRGAILPAPVGIAPTLIRAPDRPSPLSSLNPREQTTRVVEALQRDTWRGLDGFDAVFEQILASGLHDGAVTNFLYVNSGKPHPKSDLWKQALEIKPEYRDQILAGTPVDCLKRKTRGWFW